MIEGGISHPHFNGDFLKRLERLNIKLMVSHGYNVTTLHFFHFENKIICRCLILFLSFYFFLSTVA